MNYGSAMLVLHYKDIVTAHYHKGMYQRAGTPQVVLNAVLSRIMYQASSCAFANHLSSPFTHKEISP
jgi:hypothetical protein